MKNRVKQRANRKLAQGIKKNNDMHNASGNLDMTAYAAMNNIDKKKKVEK